MAGKNNTSVVNQLVSVNQNGKATSLDVFAFKNPQMASALSMLVTSNRPVSFDKKGNRVIERPNITDLRRIAAQTGESGENADAVIRMFTDVKTAFEILISSVRSPNDMAQGTLNFELKDNLHVMPLAPKLLPLVRSYAADIYPVSEKIDLILRECLRGTGSYPIFVLPENALSDVINGKASLATEAINDRYNSLPSLGVFGAPSTAIRSLAAESNGLLNRTIKTAKSGVKMVLESDQTALTTEMITFHDNPNILQAAISRQISNKVTSTKMAREHLGDANTMSDKELATLVYRNTTGRRADFMKIKGDNELKRYSVSRPLVLDLPPESVIPIIHRGKPKEPLGFIVVLDDDNMPVSRSFNNDEFEALRQSVTNNKDSMASGNMTSYLLQRASRNFGTDCTKLTSNQLTEIASQLVEADFSAKWRSGSFGTSEASISDIKRLSEMMLYRVFKNQKTKLLFVPTSYLTYFNYQVDDNGIGKNLIEEGLPLFAIRAKVMFARAIGAIKNSIGRKKVTVQIDNDEIDPFEVFETAKAEILRSNRIATTSGSLSPLEITDQVQAAGYEFSYEGEGLPSTKIEHSESASSYQRPDEQLDSDLAAMTINLTGVPPEMVEEARRSELATVAIANNIIFTRRVADMQLPFNKGFTQLMISMFTADPKFMIEIKEIIADNLKIITSGTVGEELEDLVDDPSALTDFLAMEFISNLKAFLSKPDIKTIETQLETIKLKEEEVDKALDYVFSDEAAVAQMVGERIKGNIADLRTAAKAAVMRRYMQEQGFGQEVFELINTDADGALTWDLGKDIESHAGSLIKMVDSLLVRGGRLASAADAAAPAGEETSDGGFDTGSDTPSETDESDPFADDGFGGDTLDEGSSEEGSSLDDLGGF